MKAVILAGGYGTRISEETAVRPKPMVEIGNRPLLWHIMKIYSAYGVNDFVVCCGYKSEVIKNYFANYMLNAADVTFDLQGNQMMIHKYKAEPWRVTLAETGDKTMTGGRLKRVREYLDDEAFCFTYGDGVSDVDISKLIEFHRQQKTLATLTAVQPPGRYGTFSLTEGQLRVTNFREKPKGDGAWINGGFFVLEPEVIQYIKDDSTVWEQEPMVTLAQQGQLSAFRHDGFWHSVNTLQDKNVLEDLWKNGNIPWKVWQD